MYQIDYSRKTEIPPIFFYSLLCWCRLWQLTFFHPYLHSWVSGRERGALTAKTRKEYGFHVLRNNSRRIRKGNVSILLVCRHPKPHSDHEAVLCKVRCKGCSAILSEIPIRSQRTCSLQTVRPTKQGTSEQRIARSWLKPLPISHCAFLQR